VYEYGEDTFSELDFDVGSNNNAILFGDGISIAKVENSRRFFSRSYTLKCRKSLSDRLKRFKHC
jgi:hypothetical protein